MNVLLTGATGFLGSRLSTALESKPAVNLTAAGVSKWEAEKEMLLLHSH